MISTYAYTVTPDAILPVERVIPPKASIVAARGLPRLDNMRTVMAAGTPLPPICVYQHEGYTYLIAGLHRDRVTREMGYTHIPVVFRTRTSRFARSRSPITPKSRRKDK